MVPIHRIRRILRPLGRISIAAALLFSATGVCHGVSITLNRVVSGLSDPLDIAHPNDGSGRLFIVERSGRILIWNGNTLLPTPFLDIGHLTISQGERGLLGMAFHQNYADNGQFFVHYTDLNGDTVLARYNVSANANLADPSSERIVLQVPQPANNHNGGQIRFGPDGFLYIALGDGGFSGDPNNNGQNMNTLLGKLLRIDVDNGSPYTIPADNPFIGEVDKRSEIWAYGLRNPWRFSFDSLTGDLFIADVGQAEFEEINFQPVMSAGGENYGWRLMEGFSCFNPASGCNPGNLRLPIIAYNHAIGQSVTGGYRYRGQLYPTLEGIYFYGDFVTGKIFGARRLSGGTWESFLAKDTKLLISTFGQDQQGELYVVHFNSPDGAVFRIESEEVTTDNTDTTLDDATITATVGCFISVSSR